MERIQGTITDFDPKTRKGTLTDLAGTEHLVLPGSFRKTVRLGIGQRVSFSSFNLSAGPTAQDIEISSGGRFDSPSMAGVRASQVPQIPKSF
jgi:hypothetical protein